jgi:hypothetical protein
MSFINLLDNKVLCDSQLMESRTREFRNNVLQPALKKSMTSKSSIKCEQITLYDHDMKQTQVCLMISG